MKLSKLACTNKVLSQSQLQDKTSPISPEELEDKVLECGKLGNFKTAYPQKVKSCSGKPQPLMTQHLGHSAESDQDIITKTTTDGVPSS